MQGSNESVLNAIGDCRRCILAATRKRIVIDSGNVPADVLIVGEAPGHTEDINGIPFTGASGLFMRKIMNECGLFEYKLFFTNTVLCRPPQNREPFEDEWWNCQKNIEKILGMAVPKVIIIVGRIALRYFEKYDYGKTPKLYLPHPANIVRNNIYIKDWRRKCEIVKKGVEEILKK